MFVDNGCSYSQVLCVRWFDPSLSYFCSGWSDGVSALSGYYKDLVFSIYVNNAAHQASHSELVRRATTGGISTSSFWHIAQPGTMAFNMLREQQQCSPPLVRWKR